MFLSPRNGANSKVRFAIRTASVAEQVIDGAAALPSGGWHHVAVVLNGATGTLYVDGVQVGQNTAMTLSPASLGTTGNNYIGKSQFNDPYLNGAVDDFKIFGQALNAQQSPRWLLRRPRPHRSRRARRRPGFLELERCHGAVSYNVKRALVSGGPYTLVSNTTATEFTDASLSNGTTYYYVITALNAATESLNSAEAGVLPLSALHNGASRILARRRTAATRPTTPIPMATASRTRRSSPRARGRTTRPARCG